MVSLLLVFLVGFLNLFILSFLSIFFVACIFRLCVRSSSILLEAFLYPVSEFSEAIFWRCLVE
jgi:hypothetical protein